MRARTETIRRLGLIVNVIDSNVMSWHAGLMARPFDAIRNFDRLVHDPSRLVILTALDACGGSEFMPLQFITGLSRGNLSLHLGKLLGKGLVSIEKRDRSRRTATLIRLT